MAIQQRSFVVIMAVLLLSLGAHAQQGRGDEPSIMMGFSGKMLPRDPALDPAGLYTPPQYSRVAAAHGWIELDDEEDARWWMAYQEIAERPGNIHLAVKRAMKGAGSGFTSIQILDGEAICPANGVGPNYLHNVMDFSYDSRGVPTSGGMVAAVFALERGSILAEAAKHVCLHMDRSLSQGDFKPDAKYPTAAIRLRHEGVTVVGYRVGEGGQIGLSNVWVLTSSGFSELDTAALTAVSQWRLKSNPAGTQASTNVTFSLNAAEKSQQPIDALFERMDQANRNKSKPI